MKERNRETRKLILGIICCILLGTLILFFLIPGLEESHFKIYKNESGELVDVDRIPVGWKNKEGICEPFDFTIINKRTNYGECAWIYPEQITTEWLDENCECTEKNCEYVFNSSKKEKFGVENSEEFVAKTYEGLIWFTTDEEGNEIVEYYQGNVELIEKCNPCQNYKCGKDYLVEVWNQIK